MIKALYAKAGILEAQEAVQREKDKLGVLRGGTTGHMDADGNVSAQCHRKALIRYLGLQKDPGSTSWFDMGHANESLWVDKLKKVWPHKIVMEEEYPIVWEVDNVSITGRPDIVLLGVDGNPVAGVELKSIGAVNSAGEVAFEDKPKLANLLQAAHYSSQVKVPFHLVYTCFVKGPLPYWAQKKYGQKELNPFIKEFKVEITDAGQIQYTKEDGRIVKTPFTFAGIVAFYRLVIDMADKKSLYSRFKDVSIDNTELPYDACKYCVYNEACDNYDQDYDRWIDEVSKIKEVGV
jgi:hypothetical protein